MIGTKNYDNELPKMHGRDHLKAKWVENATYSLSDRN